MKISSTSFHDGGRIPEANAFCRVDPDTHASFSDNRSPGLSWDEVPAGTRSFALIARDPDVPSQGDDVNQEGREVPADLPRVEFIHWLLWDIPGDARELAEGSHASGVTPRGKPGPEAPGDTRHGINDYTGWFAGDPDMAGDYFGYDGPCPPWNDSIVHHYHFTLYALDLRSLGDPSRWGAAELRAAMEGHVLAEASLMGTFTLNPSLR
ncbi:MAG: YbhB/YbcL family Raf kinase inhibitor-like protein [Deltaproteobacteria bacterium]|nr:YbhB/YbcL family Raf kinase inhibitor-like protein [Deltaproteobacteria bacterium]